MNRFYSICFLHVTLCYFWDRLLNKEELSVAASTLLRNLCIAPRLSLLRPCLPTLVRLVSHSNVQVSDEACCALAILIRSHKARLSPSLDSSFFTEFHNLHKYVTSSSALRRKYLECNL